MLLRTVVPAAPSIPGQRMWEERSSCDAPGKTRTQPSSRGLPAGSADVLRSSHPLGHVN